MRLVLFSSKPQGHEPNLVGVQHSDFAELETVLVCPLVDDAPAGSAAVSIVWRGAHKAVRCELVRPIHRRVLRRIGEMDEAASANVLRQMRRLITQ